MDGRKMEVIEILEMYLKNAYKNGTNITSYIERPVALGLYDRLLPLMVREFPEKAVKDYLKDLVFDYKAEKTAGDPAIRYYTDKIKRLWEGDHIVFNGTIDDLRVYNRKLSTPEIALLYYNEQETIKILEDERKRLRENDPDSIVWNDEGWAKHVYKRITYTQDHIAEVRKKVCQTCGGNRKVPDEKGHPEGTWSDCPACTGECQHKRQTVTEGEQPECSDCHAVIDRRSGEERRVRKPMFMEGTNLVYLFHSREFECPLYTETRRTVKDRRKEADDA